jgi:hypothetical protein
MQAEFVRPRVRNIIISAALLMLISLSSTEEALSRRLKSLPRF